MGNLRPHCRRGTSVRDASREGGRAHRHRVRPAVPARPPVARPSRFHRSKYFRSCGVLTSTTRTSSRSTSAPCDASSRRTAAGSCTQSEVPAMSSGRDCDYAGRVAVPRSPSAPSRSPIRANVLSGRGCGCGDGHLRNRDRRLPDRRRPLPCGLLSASSQRRRGDARERGRGLVGGGERDRVGLRRRRHPRICCRPHRPRVERLVALRDPRRRRGVARRFPGLARRGAAVREPEPGIPGVRGASTPHANSRSAHLGGGATGPRGIARPRNNSS